MSNFSKQNLCVFIFASLFVFFSIFLRINHDFQNETNKLDLLNVLLTECLITFSKYIFYSKKQPGNFGDNTDGLDDPGYFFLPNI